MFILVCWRKGVSRPSVIVTTTPAGVRARSARGHCEWLQRGRDFRHGDISFTTKGTHGYPVLHPGRRRPCGERIADPTVVHDQFEHRGGRDPPVRSAPRRQAPAMREAGIWVGFYVALALVFAASLFAIGDAQHGSEFLTGWLLEYSLSIDNLFVFIIIMGSFSVPRKYQQEVLMVGIIIAIIF